MPTAAFQMIPDAWLMPLADDQPSGPNLEYDGEFLELQTLLEGTPATELGGDKGPPEWRDVFKNATHLAERTRDLRVAVAIVRSRLCLEGVASLGETLSYVSELLSTQWETVYPEIDPDDGSCDERVGALNALAVMSGGLSDLRNARLFDVRGVGTVYVRQCLVALDRLPLRDGDVEFDQQQIRQLAEDSGSAELLTQRVDEALAAIAQIEQRVSEGLTVFDLELARVADILRDLKRLLPEREPESEPHDALVTDSLLANDDALASTSDAPRAAVTQFVAPETIVSRNQAEAAIRRVTDYFEAFEPTNPALLFIRRGAAVINYDFLKLMRELGPEGMGELDRVLGIGSDSDNGDNDD